MRLLASAALRRLLPGTVVAIVLAMPAGLAPARAATGFSCADGRAACQAVCTPDRIWRYYAGSHRRCTASCEPRFRQCAKTGVWVDLERVFRTPYIPATPY